MDSLYDVVWEDDSDESWLFLWDFKNSHFWFKNISQQCRDAYGLEYITFNEIAEFFRIDNIKDIICTEGFNSTPEQVCIIYD